MRRFCARRKLDSRLESILINPRLEGLPRARALSCFMFVFIIIMNSLLAVYLADNVRSDICTAEPLDSPRVDDECTSVSFTEIAYLGSSFEDSSTTNLLSVKINTPKSFNLKENVVGEELLERLDKECSGAYEEGNDTCLDKLKGDDNIKSMPGEEVKTVLGLGRMDNDRFYKIEISPTTYINIYVSPVSNKNGYLINAFYSNSDDNTNFGEIDLTVMPDFFSNEENSWRDMNKNLLKTIKLLGTAEGRGEIESESLSQHFTHCCRKFGLNAFQYFGLLFDYAFLLEGIITVFFAVMILKCLGYQAYDTKGRAVDLKINRNHHEEDMEAAVFVSADFISEVRGKEENRGDDNDDADFGREEEKEVRNEEQDEEKGNDQCKEPVEDVPKFIAKEEQKQMIIVEKEEESEEEKVPPPPRPQEEDDSGSLKGLNSHRNLNF